MDQYKQNQGLLGRYQCYFISIPEHTQPSSLYKYVD